MPEKDEDRQSAMTVRTGDGHGAGDTRDEEDRVSVFTDVLGASPMQGT